MMHRQASLSAVIALVFIALGSAWNDARAQAWVGDQGALDLNLDYNLAISSKVVVDKGSDFKDAGTTTHQLTLGGEYVPINHLAVNIGLPLVLLKYTGNKTAYPHPGGGKYDDGDTHATLTDLRAGVRYQFLDEPVALSAHLAFSIPVADYETIGNTVAGRHLKRLHAGASIGKLIGESTYVHLMYEFTLSEKYDRTADTKKYGQNLSDLSFTVGHRLMQQRLDLHLDANAHWTHGGVEFSNFGSFTPDEALYHDAILDEDMILVGGGIGYQVSNKLAVNLSGRLFLTGQNTQNASVFAVGLAYSPLP